MTNPPSHITTLGSITIADVYVKQVEMSGSLDVIREQLKDLPDHEARIRSLETAKAKLYGAAAVIAALVSAGGTWVGFLVTRH